MKDKNKELKDILEEISDIFDFAYESADERDYEKHICKIENKLHKFLREEGYDI